MDFSRRGAMQDLSKSRIPLLEKDDILACFTPFVFTRESFSEKVPIAISALTDNPRYLEPREYIKISRLESLCYYNGLSLSGFFSALENSLYDDYGIVGNRIDTRVFYDVLNMVADIKHITDYRICLILNWDYQNYCREKRFAYSGIRKSFSLMKLYYLLLVLDISFSSFFLFCEYFNLSYCF